MSIFFYEKNSENCEFINTKHITRVSEIVEYPYQGNNARMPIEYYKFSIYVNMYSPGCYDPVITLQYKTEEDAIERRKKLVSLMSKD